MTNQEYLERNEKGFEGDEFLATAFKNIIKDNNITTVIETGTYRGYTTKRLAEMVETVYTIEINDEYFFESGQHLVKLPNVRRALSSSPIYLKTLLNPELSLIKEKLLFFLDAHWGNVCPLLDELQVIADAKIKPVIVIHDFFNPTDPTMGFDAYNGKRFNFDFIKEKVELIYGQDYSISYNKEAEGARRGVIFIQPKVNGI